MTRRQLARRAFDPVHKRLALAAHDAAGGQKLRAEERLKNYVTACLASVRPVRRRRRR